MQMARDQAQTPTVAKKKPVDKCIINLTDSKNTDVSFIFHTLYLTIQALNSLVVIHSELQLK